MFTEKDLVAGETVLVWKDSDANVLYLGCAGLAHFVSAYNEFKIANNSNFTIEELNKHFTIDQPKSKVVPLEKKVYDFVPVICRNNDGNVWERDNLLIAVVPDAEYPYKVITDDGGYDGFNNCEFLNEQ
jgi:hypothetical protein